MWNEAYLSLGSNMGDRLQYLSKAIRLLGNENEIKVAAASSIYETDPVGYENQAKFLNMVLAIQTNVNPFSLLQICLRIEEKLGRKRTIRWGPRTIDLDILLFNKENIETEDLIIPHPRMLERAFVLVPLLELNPRIDLPDKTTLEYSLMEKRKREGVRKWKQNNGEDVFALFEN
ncbi:2-amino-4-hydroxy-6-hydroxymethyldihydropteridine diphosphokinase [Bacillaceae bacterium Marseille-Q3522]|nr:2-amino-4-hydroxy-6-hydroxymethyldihydropteridine diphosphokinase [Bacillaceae bacterium Marseille-Q3522]